MGKGRTHDSPDECNDEVAAFVLHRKEIRPSKSFSLEVSPKLGDPAMSFGKVVFQFLLTFVIAFLATAIVSFLYSLVVHSEGKADWESAVRFGIIFGILFTWEHFRKKRDS